MKPYSSSASDFATEPQYTDSIAIKPYRQSSADPASMMTIIRDQQIIAQTHIDDGEAIELEIVGLFAGIHV